MFHATKACFLVFVLALILFACAPAQLDSIQPTDDQLSPIQPTFTPPAPTQPAQDQLALPNPASVFCEEQGGRL
jgi:putative hemolysin